MRSLIVVLMLTLGACQIAAPTKVGPTAADYKATLARINSNISNNLLPTLKQLSLEKSNHIPAWWEAKIGLAQDTAEIASAMGNK